MIAQKLKSYNKVQNLKKDENILVIKISKFKNELRIKNLWQGIKRDDLDRVLEVIKKEQELNLRSLMELDYNYKQIIPYVVFKFNDSYFVMQRKETASETRLQSKLTLGIGGHINESDIAGQNIENWAVREFHEEINYTGKLDMKLYGIINDDSNDVGKVHMGLVFFLEGESDKITIKSELKSGQLVKKEDLLGILDYMESWSKTIIQDIIFKC